MGTAGQPFRFVWQVSNIGVGPTYSSWTDKIYLSTDFNIDANDINVRKGQFPNPECKQ